MCGLRIQLDLLNFCKQYDGVLAIQETAAAQAKGDVPNAVLIGLRIQATFWNDWINRRPLSRWSLKYRTAMAAYQVKCERAEKEIVRNVDPETVDILPSSVPSSSIVVTVPEPKDREHLMMSKSQVVQSTEPPILGLPGAKEKQEN